MQSDLMITKFFPSASATEENELFQNVADYFTMFSEPSRLRVLAELCAAAQALSVNEIVERCGLHQPNVSRHLNRLYTAGILDRRREKIAVFYKLKDPFVQELCHLISKKFATI